MKYKRICLCYVRHPRERTMTDSNHVWNFYFTISSSLVYSNFLMQSCHMTLQIQTILSLIRLILRTFDPLNFHFRWEPLNDIGIMRYVCKVVIRGVHLGHWVDIGSSVSGQFKIGFHVLIDFYIILNSF